jgi:metal-responsive CopG/Arc/MetJ family transcriptional regulator
VKANHQNLTISLPVPLLRKLRVCAAKKSRSMSSLIADAVEKVVEEDDEYERAKRSFIARLNNLPDRTFGGQITWTRDELHER